MRVQVSCLVAYLASTLIVVHGKNVVCYVADWTAWRSGPGHFDIDNVDTNLCTHVIYAFASLTDNGIGNPIRGTDGMEKLRNLKNGNPNVMILAAVGGWTEGSAKFSQIASSADSRGQFVQSAIDFMSQWGLDGIDIDWEYPTQGSGSRPEDVDNYVELLKDLKAGFQSKILSAAVAAGEGTASQAYKISEVTQYLDLVNLMAYDLHGSWEQETGMHSGLYGSSPNEPLTVDNSVNYWLNNGCPPEKLMLGIPLYGRSWTLADPNSDGVGAPATGPGTAGQYSQAEGSLTYYEICENINRDKWTSVFDDTRKVPYAFKDNQWVSYEDVQSVDEKVGYIKNRGLGGAMVWAVDNDDTTGVCGDKFPLLTAVNTVR